MRCVSIRSAPLLLALAGAACLPPTKVTDTGSNTDMSVAGGAPDLTAGAVASAYFNPDIQQDLDKLGCTAGPCHGSNASPLLVAAPASPADWMSNYGDIHIDCTTLDCLGGGASALLLQKPLVGGAAHAGTKPFASTADPIYQRWLAWITAGAPYDASVDMAAPSDLSTGGAADMTMAADMGKPELVTITFTTSMSPSGAGSPYSPKNVVAVWIETSAGVFEKTAARWANTRRSKLVAWVAKAGAADVDAVSGATNANYGTLTAKWDMTARAGGAAPVDGVYTIRMELADSNASTAAQNNQGTFTFNRNGTASTQTALSNGGFSNVSIAYSGR